ncbi:MAG: 3'-5' exonuclease [Candidatus Omnitrophota bacterium]
MIRGAGGVEFTIFDTETTGLSIRRGDRIIEIAAVRFKGKEDISYFESLINPGCSVSLEAYNINKISAGMLLSAPKPREVIVKFMDFIRGSCLCSYNIAFDIGFLNNELKLLGLSRLSKVFVVDILKLARQAIPGLDSYALQSVAKSLGVKGNQKHRAFSDVLMAQKVFYILRDMLERRFGCRLKLEKYY